MKKILSAITVILSALTLTLLTSCQGVIFASIREEVELTDAQISGDVYSVIRHTGADSKEYLYTSFGKIARKNLGFDSSHVTSTKSAPYGGQWELISKPANLITGMTSNSSSELYALSLKIATNDDDGENQPVDWTVYWSDNDGASWKTVTVASTGKNLSADAGSYSQVFCIFGTNTPKKETRAAFVNFNSVIYILEGGEAKTLAEAGITASGNDSDSSFVATLDGSKYWFSSSPLTTNATYAADATIIYKASSTSFYYTEGTSWSSGVSVSSLSNVESIAYTKDHLLAGTSGGFDVIVLKDDKPTDATGTLLANTNSTLSSSYIVKNVVVIDPSQTYGNADMYVSMDFENSSSSTSATFTNVGLWSYYPGRGKWNRE